MCIRDREGIEGRRREERRLGRSTWSAEYHVTTGQKNGKGERRTCGGTTRKVGKSEQASERERGARRSGKVRK